MSLQTTVLSLRRRLLSLADSLSFLAPLLLRVTLASVFIQTGWGKLNDLEQVTGYFTQLGIPAPGLNAAVAAGTEFFGGLLLLLGLGTRLVALPMGFTMVVAILTAKREQLDGLALFGFEEWSYLTMFLTVALLGPGGASLDALLARRQRAASPEAATPSTQPSPVAG
jgi:putative oxidoreductase